MNQRLKYLLSSVARVLSPEKRRCPSCGHSESTVEDRKYLVTTLRRCASCQLLFRAPRTPDAEQEAFYQSDYRQGFTTEVPDDATLRSWMNASFRGTEKDYSPYLRVLESLGVKPGHALFDFGCSWGYGSWQLRRQGYRVESFEISVGRAEFAREKLGLNVTSSLSQVAGPFDVFFSAHVLEHVPSVSEAGRFAFRVLKPGGLFVAFTPNGSASHRARNREGWHRLWGLVHPNFLDEVYYRRLFAKSRLILLSNPYDLVALADWAHGRSDEPKVDLAGDELLAVVRK